MDYTKIGNYLFLGESPKSLKDYEHMLDSFDLIIQFNHPDDTAEKTLIKHIGKQTSEDQNAYNAQDIMSEIDARGKANSIQFFHGYIDDKVGRGATKQYGAAFDVYIKAKRIDPTTNVYVHCKSGVHRSSHFIIFMMMEIGFSYEESFMHIQKLRPLIEKRESLKHQLLKYFGERDE